MKHKTMNLSMFIILMLILTITWGRSYRTWSPKDTITMGLKDRRSFNQIKTSALRSESLDVEIRALFDLYSSTGGLNWNWDTSPQAAPQWTFNASKQQNPCADDSLASAELWNMNISSWQGISCNHPPDFCYTEGYNCSIEVIDLPSFGVRINIKQ